MNGLQPEGQRAASEEVREQVKALVEECGAALSSRAEETISSVRLGGRSFGKALAPSLAPVLVDHCYKSHFPVV
jgi:hypothetical protein